MEFNINTDATNVWNDKTIAFARAMADKGNLWLQDETGPKCPTPSAICHNTGFVVSFEDDGVVIYWDRFGTGRGAYKLTNVGDALAFMTNAPHGDDASDEELDRWERLWEKQSLFQFTGYKNK